MLRTILSVIAGILVAFAVTFASDALFHALVPSAPPPADTGDREAMRAYVAGQPTGVLIALPAGWSLAAFAGSALAARLARRGAMPGWIVTGLFLLGTAANFLMVPHPTWMVVLGVALILAAGWAGSRMGARTDRQTPHTA
jgi:hypothetical protein